jgi:hypothetical protein
VGFLLVWIFVPILLIISLTFERFGSLFPCYNQRRNCQTNLRISCCSYFVEREERRKMLWLVICVVISVIGSGYCSSCEVGRSGSTVTCTQAATSGDLYILNVDPADISQVLYRGVSINWNIFVSHFPNLESVHCLLIHVACDDVIPKLDTDCVCEDDVEMIAPVAAGTDAADMMMRTTPSPRMVTSSTVGMMSPPPHTEVITTSTQRSVIAGIFHGVQQLLPSSTPPTPAKSDLTGECPAVYSQGVIKFLSAIPTQECMMTFFGGEGSFIGLVFAALSVTIAYLYSGYSLSWGTIRLILMVS